MFTGLVETTATVASIARRGNEARLAFSVDALALHALGLSQEAGSAARGSFVLGESISVSGVCLTVASFDDTGFSAHASEETLRVTTLGDYRPGQRVNLERSLALGERLGGHLVLGHVDGVGTVRAFEPNGEARRVVIAAKPELMRFFAPKGSVTVDGTSLTVNRLPSQDCFELMLVPHTLAVTTLGGLSVGARVNLEVDVLARYVGRMLEAAGIVPAGSSDAALQSALKRSGFVP